MHLITTALIHLILLCEYNVGLTSFRSHFRFYVENVASIYHSNWRENFLAKNPTVKNRFKLTKAETHYNASDFIYPMILTVGSCLVHRNLKVARARSNSSLVYVDILNMDYKELPSDWAFENRQTARIACKYVLQGLQRNRVFNQDYLEEISNIIHIQWMKRNARSASKELMVPYRNLTEIEKEKDRKAVLLACRLFNELYLYQRFHTTPVHFLDHIIL